MCLSRYNWILRKRNDLSYTAKGVLGRLIVSIHYYSPKSLIKTSLDSEIVCQCDGRYQADQCNPTIDQSGETSNLNNPSSGMTLCEEGDLGYKIQLAAWKEANLGYLSMLEHQTFIDLFS